MSIFTQTVMKLLLPTCCNVSLSGRAEQTSEVRRKKFNGYTMFHAHEMSHRVQEPGESREECRKRVHQTCTATWRAPGLEAEALRRDWQLKAIAHNTSVDALVPIEPNGSKGREIVAAEPLPTYFENLKTQDGYGVLGIGDRSHGLSLKTLAKAEESEKGFVNSFAAKWRTRTGDGGEPVNIGQAGTTILSCREMYDFCTADINNQAKFKTLTEHIVKYIRAYRKKHLVSGRNKGPNATIQLPLLFMWKPTLGINVCVSPFKSFSK